MSHQRRAAVAGRFYLSDADLLRAAVSSMLDAVEVDEDEPLARAYVVPHAGHRFSGSVAAQVYARLRRHREKIHRIVLIGPSHFVRLTGMAASPATSWDTPLGTVEAERAHGLQAHAQPHEREHSLEVQLPFLQECLDDFVIVPVAVGKTPTAGIVGVLDRLVDDSSLLLCSTDLSHFHELETAKQLDAATADAVLDGDSERIGPGDACGLFALRGTVAWAKAHGAKARLLRLGTSADTGADPSRVVGYPAFAFG